MTGSRARRRPWASWVLAAFVSVGCGGSDDDPAEVRNEPATGTGSVIDGNLDSGVSASSRVRCVAPAGALPSADDLFGAIF